MARLGADLKDRVYARLQIKRERPDIDERKEETRSLASPDRVPTVVKNGTNQYTKRGTANSY